ncbi:MAG: FHA domain-containing protein [Deltaproteobacteria bacterium]|nr:FHA domain-containing protein [Deltaproteobacteria bacterium]
MTSGAQGTDDRTEPLGDQSSRLVLLVVHAGGIERCPLPAAGAVTLGRSPECGVCIDESSVSREHALLVLGSPPTVKDLGSENGIFLRGQRLGPDQVEVVHPGEALGLGRALVVLQPLGFDLSLASPPLLGRASAPPAVGPVVRDAAMRRLYAMAERVANTELPVLILGETGVGKEGVAEAVHAASSRAAAEFVRVDCGALTESLIEATLFGHAKGAFTGATQRQTGLIEAADGGTLFLDEVGELPLSAQAKLLRVLERGELLRLGESRPRSVRVRFVSATNRDLRREVEAGRFRRDLFYRLNGITLEVPPLRERPDELVPLARFFVREACARAGADELPIAEDARALLRRHAWPGNVRELRHLMQRAVALAGDSAIDSSHLPDEFSSRTPGAQAEVQKTLPTAPQTLPSQKRALERQRIVEALEQAAGNQTRAAELLGISRRTLVNRLEQFDLPRPRKRR